MLVRKVGSIGQAPATQHMPAGIPQPPKTPVIPLPASRAVVPPVPLAPAPGPATAPEETPQATTPNLEITNESLAAMVNNSIPDRAPAIPAEPEADHEQEPAASIEEISHAKAASELSTSILPAQTITETAINETPVVAPIAAAVAIPVTPLQREAEAAAQPAEPATGIEGILRNMGVKPTHIQYALARTNRTGESLTVIMQDTGFISQEKLAEALARQHNLPYFSNLDVETISGEEIKHLTVPEMNGYVPVGMNQDGDLLVACAEPAKIQEARNTFHQHKTRMLIASNHTVQTVFQRYFVDSEGKFDKALAEYEEAVSKQDDDATPGLIQHVIGSLLRHACYAGASDIMLMKTSNRGLIRLKIQGTGILFRDMDVEIFDLIMNKFVSDNGVKAEDLKGKPQETRVHFIDHLQKHYSDIANRYQFRLQLTETDARGRDAVMRVLDRQNNVAEFDRLDFDRYTKSMLRKYINTRNGMVIVTGPTGSGKTTTLNACLKEIDPVEKWIMTVENPVEYPNGLWNQQEPIGDMQEEEGFKVLLNADLRKAPDVILFGEVRRSAEVANTVIDAANTGHLVWTTLHTNDAPMAIARLDSIGADMGILANVLLGVLAQRLVRELCRHCKAPDDRPETMDEFRDRPYLENIEKSLYRAVGCPHCYGTGYRGRRMIYELLDVTESGVREMIERREHITEIQKMAMKDGNTMYARGLRLVAEGLTSIDEIRSQARKDK